jgi:hypothetical protein
MVLVTALLLTAVLALLGSTAVMTTTTDMKIAGNYREGVKSLYDAEAGIHYTIGLLRSAALPLPASGMTSTPAVTAPSGFSFSGITIQNLSANGYRLTAQGNALNSAKRTIDVIFTAGSAVPPITDGAVAMYGNNPTFNSGGSSDIRGTDWNVPNDFDCNGASCRPDTAGPATAVAGVYTAETAAQGASVTGGGIVGNPAYGSPNWRQGGGTNQEQTWLDFVNNIVNNNLADANQGTRTNPTINVVTSGQTFNGNTNGAGILIVLDGGSCRWTGTATFEGLIILVGGSSSFSAGTFNLYGSVVTIGHDSGKAFTATGNTGFNFSSQALSNLSNIGSMRTISMTSWRDTSLQ